VTNSDNLSKRLHLSWSVKLPYKTAKYGDDERHSVTIITNQAYITSTRYFAFSAMLS